MRASPLPKSPSHLLHVVPIMLRFLCHLAGASRPWHTVSVTSNLSHARLPETHVHRIKNDRLHPSLSGLARITEDRIEHWQKKRFGLARARTGSKNNRRTRVLLAFCFGSDQLLLMLIELPIRRKDPRAI